VAEKTSTASFDAGPPGFAFLETNIRPPKPRTTGVTEIRGAYYRAMGPRVLEDLLETMAEHIDTFKFAGGTFAVQPRSVTKRMIDLCHANGVKVSSGGSLEHAVVRRGDNVAKFLGECADLGFDMIEVSGNYINITPDDQVRLTEAVVKAGFICKPEIAVRFGTGGGMTSIDELEAAGIGDVAYTIRLGRRFLDAGATMLMVESEGITEDVKEWRTDVVSAIVDGIGVERLMFEAADPQVFAWYVRMYGVDVNLFVDHSQIFHLSSLRCGVGGGKDLWNKVIALPPEMP
jgi:phosphosulfolactate synthase (CoM biosynthesis protein A)